MAVAGMVLVLLGSGGCSVLDPGVRALASAPHDVTEGVDLLLRQRQNAVRSGNERAFRRTVDPARPGLRRTEQDYWANLSQLPVRRFSQRLVSPLHSVPGGWSGTVRTRLQLAGFDRVPVTQEADYTFVAGGGGWQIAARRLPQRSRTVQPWDLGPVQVHRAPGVLVVTDAGSTDRGAELVRQVSEARRSVRAIVPFGRHSAQGVVVHALSTRSLLDTLPNLPGGDPSRLEAVAYRVHGGAEGQTLAATRIVLNPTLLTAPEAGRSRVLRHELTHVALGDRNDRLPTWLAEGVAEYVAARSLPTSARVISGEAIRAARAGRVTLPSNAAFAAQASGAQYGVSWWACVALAERQGEARLWRLVRRTSAAGSRPSSVVLREVTGLDRESLAELARERILGTYR